MVLKTQSELYMGFVDLRAFKNMLPADKQASVEATYDTLSAVVQGFRIGVKVTAREPFHLIAIEDDGAPFHFRVEFHFDADIAPVRTDFHIEVDADLNMMMKMMLGSKIQQAIDQIVDGLVAASEGRMPEGFDPSTFSGKF